MPVVFEVNLILKNLVSFWIRRDTQDVSDVMSVCNFTLKRREMASCGRILFVVVVRLLLCEV